MSQPNKNLASVCVSLSRYFYMQYIHMPQIFTMMCIVWNPLPAIELSYKWHILKGPSCKNTEDQSGKSQFHLMKQVLSLIASLSDAGGVVPSYQLTYIVKT